MLIVSCVAGSLLFGLCLRFDCVDVRCLVLICMFLLC